MISEWLLFWNLLAIILNVNKLISDCNSVTKTKQLELWYIVFGSFYVDRILGYNSKKKYKSEQWNIGYCKAIRQIENILNIHLIWFYFVRNLWDLFKQNTVEIPARKTKLTDFVLQQITSIMSRCIIICWYWNIYLTSTKIRQVQSIDNTYKNIYFLLLHWYLKISWYLKIWY